MEPFKRSTARDFRINAQTVESILDVDISGDESDGTEGEGDGCDPPKAKRVKTT